MRPKLSIIARTHSSSGYPLSHVSIRMSKLRLTHGLEYHIMHVLNENHLQELTRHLEILNFLIYNAAIIDNIYLEILNFLISKAAIIDNV